MVQDRKEGPIHGRSGTSMSSFVWAKKVHMTKHPPVYECCEARFTVCLKTYPSVPLSCSLPPEGSGQSCPKGLLRHEREGLGISFLPKHPQVVRRDQLSPETHLPFRTCYRTTHSTQPYVSLLMLAQNTNLGPLTPSLPSTFHSLHPPESRVKTTLRFFPNSVIRV